MTGPSERHEWNILQFLEDLTFCHRCLTDLDADGRRQCSFCGKRWCVPCFLSDSGCTCAASEAAKVPCPCCKRLCLEEDMSECLDCGDFYCGRTGCPTQCSCDRLCAMVADWIEAHRPDTSE
jgi:hypothetical protein